MNLISRGWDRQHRFEKWFKEGVEYFGPNFLSGLIGLSFLIFGFAGIPWVHYIDGVPIGFSNVFDYLINGNIQPFWINPIYWIFIGLVVIFISISNKISKNNDKK